MGGISVRAALLAVLGWTTPMATCVPFPVRADEPSAEATTDNADIDDAASAEGPLSSEVDVLPSETLSEPGPDEPPPIGEVTVEVPPPSMLQPSTLPTLPIESGAEPPPATKESISVYFVALEHRDISIDRALLVEDLVLTALASTPNIAVRSNRDLADALARAEKAQRDDCFDDSATCVREIALTLGARFALAGTVSQVQRTVTTELVLLDTKTGLPIGREQIDATTAVSLQARLPATLSNLFANVTQTPRVEVAPENQVRSFDDVEVLTGAAATGLLTGGVLAISAISALAILQVAFISFETAAIAFNLWVPFSLVVPLFVGLAFSAASLVGDLASQDESVHFGRAAIAAASGVGFAVLVFPLSTIGALGAGVILSYAFGALSDVDAPFTNESRLAGAVGASILTVAASGLLGVAASGMGLAIFAMTSMPPSFGEE